ncbi:MAG: hypothetical protein HYT98_05140 [Candidatus Sungbacteria bacterium]|nr:hypothetical protein [Candidatus Sungbacteria bacterium]
MPFYSLKNISARISLKSFFARTSREDLIFGGTVLLLLLFLTVFIWGGYVFFTVRRPIERQPALSIKIPPLTPEDFDEMAKLLDIRDQKFKDILAE